MSPAAVGTGRRRVMNLDCDVRILVIVLLLMGVGVSLVASSSSFFAGSAFSDYFALTRRHVARTVIALFAMILAMHIDYRLYRKAAPVMLVFGIALMLLLMAFGPTVRNVQRWLPLPVVGGSLQPADIVRTTMVFFLAFWITRSGAQLRDLRRGFLPAAAVIVAVAGLIAATPNYGTAAATVAIALVMLFAGGARLLHLAGFAAAGVGAGVLALMREAYTRERIAAFWNQGEAVTDANWQLVQSLIGLGSGGLFGVGFGDSEQKLSWLPDAYTDFIFSILGEELGLLGTLLVSALFLLLALRALKISRRCNDTFGEMLVIGIASSIFIYALLNMMVATGLFPVTGLPLPFLSYGGSALVVNAFAIGVLLNVSRVNATARERGQAR